MIILDIYKKPLYTLYQWDVNQYVNIVGINPEMPVSVQFWRAGQTEAFVVESTVSGNAVTTAIPNELLREAGELVIYIWQDTGVGEQKGGRTEAYFNVPIKERAQPSDYIYDDNVEYITVKTAVEDAQAAAKLANDTAEDIKQKADSGEFDGADGKSATITIGTVTTVSSDTPASVTNSGTETDAILNFEIPKGADGSGGSVDLDTLEKIAIKTTIEGNPAMSNSSAEWRIPLIEAYGKSTQDAEPTPEAPQEIKSSVVTGIKITDGAEQAQTIPLSTPVTLRGIPSESGNVTINGQKFLSDYIGQKDGIYGVTKLYAFGENDIVFDFMSTPEQRFDKTYNRLRTNVKPGYGKGFLCNFCAKYNALQYTKIFWASLGSGHIYIYFEESTGIATLELANQFMADLIKEKDVNYIYQTAETFEPLPEADQQALKDLKTFYPTSIISWETQDGSGAWTKAEIIHDPTNYIDEKFAEITAQQTALQADILKIGGTK